MIHFLRRFYDNFLFKSISSQINFNSTGLDMYIIHIWSAPSLECSKRCAMCRCARPLLKWTSAQEANINASHPT